MNNPDQKTAAGKDAVHIELAPPSFTMRVGKRRLTMSWRARKPVPMLLTGLLRRSWRAMFGRGLRISMTAAAICAAWNVPALAAAPPVNTLPTGGVITSGTATITQNGNTLNINQSTQQAIGNFTSFSIGANATVNISQPNSAAAFLARVTGTDPSLIYGHLRANGMVALINQNGIMVGPGGVVDVARFIASTLNITDGDFLAGRLTFNAGATVGNVVNEGTIKTGTGGSVYLIGANVTNSGVIQSPKGEILLVAGQTVQLIDTATPGVTVNVTGNAGNVTNLGTITAEAGRIGIAAGLITNSGNINASSVVSEGGRIFLRASQNLTTTASSNITADGATKGGSVVLYSDGAAYIDGDVSAKGAPGLGGFVETSGKKTLDVVKAPDVGSGGEWLIDPYDLTVVATGESGVSNSGNVITSTAGGSTIEAGTIVTQLNQGNSVTLTTGAGGAANGGNITVNAAINKTTGTDAALTLNADNNIIINADITSTSNKLGLNLNTNVNGLTSGTHSAQVNGATIGLNGGILNVSEGTGGNGNGNGNLSINNGSFLNLSSNLIVGDLPVGGNVKAGNLTINTGGSLANTFGSDVTVTGTLGNNGVVNLQNSHLTTGGMTNSASMTLGNVSGSLGAVVNSGTLGLSNLYAGVTANSVSNSGALTLTGSSTLTTTGSLTNAAGGSVTLNSSTLNVNVNLFNTGAIAVNNGATLHAGALNNTGGTTVNASTLNVASLTNAVGASVTLSDSGLSATDIVHNAGTFITTNSTINTVNGFTNMVSGVLTLNYLSKFNNGSFNNQGLLNAYGSGGNFVTFENGFTNSGLMNLKGSIMANSSATNSQGGTLNLGAAGETTTISGSGLWGNDGTLNIVGTGNQVTIGGAVMNNQTGTMLVSGSGASLSTGTFTNTGSVTLASGGSASVTGAVTNVGSMLVSGSGTSFSAGTFTNTGSVTLASGSSASVTGAVTNGGTMLVSGSDTSLSTGAFTNTGIVTLGSGVSALVGGTVSNSGSLTLSGANLAASGFNNEDGGSVSGTGSFSLGGTGVFFNNGILSPGGDNAVGSLSILGSYTQGGKGILKLDFASATNYDSITVLGSTIDLAGTLITKLLNTYRPPVGTTFTPIQGVTASTGSFRYVEGDIVTSGGVKNMIKAGYNLSGGQSGPDALRLTMSAPEEITFIGNSDSQWGNINSWSSTYIPTAIDSVLIPEGASVSYSGGSRAESLENMTVQGSGAFNMYGGNLTVNNNVSSPGYFNVTGGTFTLNGTGRFYSLGLGADFVGGSNSVINVTDIFQQSGGSINSAGDVALSMNSGDLVVGSITARNLVLESRSGSIEQQDTALHVTKQLLTSSVTGTTLTSSTNRIAAFAGNNRGINDIRVVNNLELADTSVFQINGVTNANGSISIINTGATATTALGSNANFLTGLPVEPDAPVPALAERLTTLGIVTNGTVSAGMLAHTVTIEAHSPLTIGSGGITAAGGISLAAGTQGSNLSNDSLVINGQLVSGGGIINLVAGNSLNINANITGAYTPGVPAPVYGPGVTLNGVLVGPSIQTTPNPTTSTTTTPITVATDTTSQIDRSVNNTQNTTTSNTPSTSGTNPVIDNTQTTGGGAGNFGGDDSEPAGGQSKPAGDGKKAVKLYCS
jgi:filamentous hemagglutinin family protein